MQFTEKEIQEALSLPKRGRVALRKHFNLSQKEARKLAAIVRDRGDVRNEVKSETKSNQYKSGVISAFDNEGRVMDIDKYCEHYGLPRKDIQSYKLVAHTGTPFYNIVFREIVEDLDFLTDEFFSNIVKRYARRCEYELPNTNHNNNVTRGIYTDVHVGMEPDIESTAPKHHTWNFESQKERVLIFASDLIESSEEGVELFVDELGDFADGQSGQTTRGGHSLPQNMHDDEMFDNCVALKISLADTLVSSSKFKRITFNNITNDNHAGSFDYYISSAVKQILEIKYKGLVEVVNHRKFMNHYIVGDHAFILSHGKDKKNLKFGFKPKIDAESEKKITNYILEHKINSPYIEFSKGDSHQLLLDYSSSDQFDYFNYHSFAPPSEWVQVGFQQGISGYVIQQFNKSKRRKLVTPIIF